jgi:hypothetical protein
MAPMVSWDGSAVQGGLPLCCARLSNGFELG